MWTGGAIPKHLSPIWGSDRPRQAQHLGLFACAPAPRFDAGMAPRLLTTLTGRDLPKIRQSREPEPSIVNEKTIADFARVLEQTGVLEREPVAPEAQSAAWSSSG
jgi:hypothetical protein